MTALILLNLKMTPEDSHCKLALYKNEIEEERLLAAAKSSLRNPKNASIFEHLLAFSDRGW